jgi:hypothetical protein
MPYFLVVQWVALDLEMPMRSKGKGEKGGRRKGRRKGLGIRHKWRVASSEFRVASYEGRVASSE